MSTMAGYEDRFLVNMGEEARVMPGIYLNCSPCYFLRLSFSLNPELPDLAILVGQQARGSPLSLPPQHWDYRHVSHLLYLYGWWGIELRPSCLNHKQFTSRASFQACEGWVLFSLETQFPFIVHTDQLQLLKRTGMTAYLVHTGCFALDLRWVLLCWISLSQNPRCKWYSNSFSWVAGNVTSHWTYMLLLCFSTLIPNKHLGYLVKFKDLGCKYKILVDYFPRWFWSKWPIHDILKEPRKANRI